MALMKKIKLKRIINMKECADKQNPVREPWESLLFTRMLKRRGGVSFVANRLCCFQPREMFVSLVGFYTLIPNDTYAHIGRNMGMAE